MIRLCIFNLLLIGFITPLLNAQQSVNREQDSTKLVSLRNDAAFKPFQQKMNNILKSANGRRTNFAAVKALFESNKSLLQQLKVKHDITAVKLQGEINYQSATATQNKLIIKTPVKVVTYMPPYSEKEIHDYINTRNDGTYESGSNNNIGKIAITTSVEPGRMHWYDIYVSVFRQSIQVPADPTIVKAQVVFFYSYFSTGWDTEYGIMYTDLVINTTSNFVSPAYNQMEANSTPPYMTAWKKIIRLANEQFESLRDYSISKDSHFIINGNVTPGSTIDFKFGLSFRPYSNRVGSFGAYHYQEYILKKIEVRYYNAN